MLSGKTSATLFTDNPPPVQHTSREDYVSLQSYGVAVKVSSEDMAKKLQLRLVDGCCDGWHFCLLYDLHVGECGCCGVEDFGVVCGFDVEDGS